MWKQKIKSAWTRFRAWFISILVAVGLLSLPIVEAGPIGFSWTNPTANTDGSVFDPATELAEIRIYCNGDPTPMFVSLGDATSFADNVAPGEYTCYATAFDTSGMESGPSNTVVKTVEKAPPNPPVLNNL